MLSETTKNRLQSLPKKIPRLELDKKVKTILQEDGCYLVQDRDPSFVGSRIVAYNCQQPSENRKARVTTTSADVVTTTTTRSALGDLISESERLDQVHVNFNVAILDETGTWTNHIFSEHMEPILSLWNNFSITELQTCLLENQQPLFNKNKQSCVERVAMLMLNNCSINKCVCGGYLYWNSVSLLFACGGFYDGTAPRGCEVKTSSPTTTTTNNLPSCASRVQ